MRKLFIAIALFVGIFSFAQQKKKKKNPKNFKETKAKKKVVQEVKSFKYSVISPSTVEVPEVKEEDYLRFVKKLEKNRGWVSNRNSYVSRGVWGYIKGVYSESNKIYVMIELKNKTNINYDVEIITFITKAKNNREKNLKNEDKVLTPIWQTEFETLHKKSKQKLIFVFDKFTLAENKDLIFVMDEKDGERTLRIPIAAKYVNGAKYIK